MGYNYYPIVTFGDGTGRYEIDLNNAIKSGEVQIE